MDARPSGSWNAQHRGTEAISRSLLPSTGASTPPRNVPIARAPGARAAGLRSISCRAHRSGRAGTARLQPCMSRPGPLGERPVSASLGFRSGRAAGSIRSDLARIPAPGVVADRLRHQPQLAKQGDVSRIGMEGADLRNHLEEGQGYFGTGRGFRRGISAPAPGRQTSDAVRDPTPGRPTRRPIPRAGSPPNDLPLSRERRARFSRDFDASRRSSAAAAG